MYSTLYDLFLHLLPYVNFQKRIKEPISNEWIYPFEYNGVMLKTSDLCKISYFSDQKRFIAGASWLCQEKAFLKLSHGKTVHYYVRENFLVNAKLPFPHMDVKVFHSVCKQLSVENLEFFVHCSLLMYKHPNQSLYIKDIFRNPILPFSKQQLSTKRIRFLFEKMIQKNVFHGQGKTKERETFCKIPPIFKGSSYKHLPSYIRLRLLVGV